MVAKRQGFQKVYDIAERVLPKGVNDKLPTEKEYAQYLITKTIRANGLAAKNEIGYLRPNTKNVIGKVLLKMEEEGIIIPAKIKGVDELLYTTQQNLDRATNTKTSKTTSILSPFDNSVIQRSRLKKLFDFDYTIECYVPEPKRQYGYFCLPVLYGDTFIGRLDCKAERSEKVLAVKNMFYEKKPDEKLKTALEKALKKFAVFNGCTEIKGI